MHVVKNTNALLKAVFPGDIYHHMQIMQPKDRLCIKKVGFAFRWLSYVIFRRKANFRVGD